MWDKGLAACHPRHQGVVPEEREELTVVVFGSSIGQVGSDCPWLSTAEEGTVRVQTARPGELGTSKWAPAPRGISTGSLHQ